LTCDLRKYSNQFCSQMCYGLPIYSHHEFLSIKFLDFMCSVLFCFLFTFYLNVESVDNPLESLPYLQKSWERIGSPLPANSYYDSNTLKIVNFQEQNAGKYRCNIVDDRGTLVTYRIEEIVYFPVPQITLHPKMPIMVNENQNADIYCEVNGEQPIQVSWQTVNNRPLPP